MRRIVVGVDGSAESRAALRWAADVAMARGATLEAVRAWEYPPALREWAAVPSNYGYLPMVLGIEQVEREAREDLAAAVGDVLGPRSDVPVTQQVVEGPSRPGAHRRRGRRYAARRQAATGLVGLLLGSVARACTDHASCPVVVPRAPGRGGASEVAAGEPSAAAGRVP